MSGTASLFISTWPHDEIHKHICTRGTNSAISTLKTSRSNTIFCTSSFHGTNELFTAFYEASDNIQRPFLYLSMYEFDWWGYLLLQSSKTLDGFGSDPNDDTVSDNYSITQRNLTIEAFPHCAAVLVDFLAEFAPAPQASTTHRKRVGRNRPLIDPEKAFYRFFEILGGVWPYDEVQC